MSESTSFASFVKDARDRKKNEALAQEFLGRGRKSNNVSGAGSLANSRNTSEKPTLLSRISGGAGVQKQRSSSAKPAGSIDGKWQHDLHKSNNPQAAASKRPTRPAPAQQLERNTRSFNKFASTLSKNTNAQNGGVGGFNIRGVANGGPVTIIASNFAPGTTAADVEAVMAPIGGETLGCRLLSSAPTVMVELQFANKSGAEKVIATFNNQKADGRLLYVYLMEATSNNPPAQLRPTHAMRSLDDMDVDTGADIRGGSYQDGRYGFSESSRRSPPRGPRRRY